MKLLALLLFLFFLSSVTYALNYQSIDNTSETNEPDKQSEPRETRRIELIRAGSMEFDKRIGDDARRLLGDVVFKHEDAYMYCDSAYLYSIDNSMKAFSNIHIQIGDTIDIYGDILYYNGNTSIAELHQNVRMEDEQMVLTTDHLVYDLKANTANYYNGGKLVDQDNTLTSIWGFYYADLKHFFFKDDVFLVNPEYTMESDTLKYNTLNEIAHFFGPTTIISDENTIFCKNGWYDTRNDIAQFNREAFIHNREHYLTGDSIFYDRNAGYGKAIMNVIIKDTVQNAIISGHFAEHFEKKGFSVVTKEALLTAINNNDSLFLHADTLTYVFMENDTNKIEEKSSIIKPDSVNIAEKVDLKKELSSINIEDEYPEVYAYEEFETKDTKEATYKEEDKDIRRVLAYNRGKFYRTDLQGISDSIIYSFADSIIYMYHEPILWSEEHQLTAKKIDVNTWDEVVNKVTLHDNAFIISQEDKSNFNQIKGHKIVGYFRNNILYKIDVFGNGETIYYIRDEKNKLIGINKALSSKMIIYVKENQVNQIVFLDSPEANLFPPDDLPDEQRILRHFKWYDDIRPRSKGDIFIWKPIP